MGSSISIWHWVVVLVIIGVPVGMIIWSIRRKTSSEGAPVGIGGWLLLLAIGQTLAPVRTLLETAKSTEAYDQLMPLPGGAVVVYGELALMAAIFVLQVVTTVLLYRKSRLFRRFFVYQWVSIPVMFVVDVLLVSLALGLPVSQLIGGEDLARTIAGFVGTGLWVWYLFRSVRVRNTFEESARLTQVFA